MVLLRTHNVVAHIARVLTIHRLVLLLEYPVPEHTREPLLLPRIVIHRQLPRVQRHQHNINVLF